MSFFENRTLLIVTKHGKEAVIAPKFEAALQVNCLLATDFDTDNLGTFSGERERKLDPIATLREKCNQAMAIYNCDLAIASEGSFGAHPSIFIASADDELVMLLDKKNNFEIIAREISMDTNFSGSVIKNEWELLKFLNSVKFPSHGVIIKKSETDLSEMVKGITDMELALKTFREFQKSHGTAFVETDMRALYNPTRMQVIGKAVEKLIDKIQSHCSECDFPGFAIADAVSGLPCECCGQPTKSVLYHIYSCQNCQHNEHRYFPRGKKTEEATYCDYCNP